MTEPTAADRARAITWSHASAPWSKVEHEIEQAILAAETDARSSLAAEVAKVAHGAIEQIEANNALKAQVSALREALETSERCVKIAADTEEDHLERVAMLRTLGAIRAALADTAASAEAYTARIREKALEEAAREVETGCPRTKEWSQRSLWLDRAAAAVRDLATPPATEEAK